MAVSDSLGPQKQLELPQGTIRYRERGDGPPIVFAHGLLVNGDLWRKVVPRLADRYRCITPDLPIGSHDPAMSRDADLSSGGLATILGDFIEAVDATGCTLVGNDTGGALCQILVTTRPELVERLVLTSCDVFEIFPPRHFKLFRVLAGYVPGAPVLFSQLARIPALQRSPAAFGWVAKHPIEPQIVESYTRPARMNRAIRRDTTKILRGIENRYTLDAAALLPRFRKPALVVWAAEDRLFPVDYGRRLAELLGAEFVVVDDSYTFIAEDQPDRLADAIGTFLASG